MDYKIDLKMQRQAIEELLLSTEVEGIKDLIRWLRSGDYYLAPASTRYHGCREGGLALHCYCIYDILKRQQFLAEDFSERSMILCAFLHDLCKIDVYSKTWRNVKRYTETGTRRDEGGRFEWVTEQSYSFEDALPLGHAPKSVYLINKHLDLSEQETAIILHHMGPFAGQDAARDFSAAARIWPEVALFHSADLQASYCMEDRNIKWLEQIPWVKL